MILPPLVFPVDFYGFVAQKESTISFQKCTILIIFLHSFKLKVPPIFQQGQMLLNFNFMGLENKTFLRSRSFPDLGPSIKFC